MMKKSKKSTKKTKAVKKSSPKKAQRKVPKNFKKKTIKKVSFIPKGYNAVTPYLIVDNGKEAIKFYVNVFGAKEVMRMEHSNGKLGHAELKIGDAKIMLADECPEMDASSPNTFGGSPVGIHLYTKNVDDTVNRAVQAGATLLRGPENMFYGDRSASLQDPFGHKWHISTHFEDVTPLQMKKRAAALFGQNNQ